MRSDVGNAFGGWNAGDGVLYEFLSSCHCPERCSSLIKTNECREMNHRK